MSDGDGSKWHTIIAKHLDDPMWRYIAGPYESMAKIKSILNHMSPTYYREVIILHTPTDDKNFVMQCIGKENAGRCEGFVEWEVTEMWLNREPLIHPFNTWGIQHIEWRQEWELAGEIMDLELMKVMDNVNHGEEEGDDG